MKVTVPHLVQYQGSKRKLAPEILRYMPKRFNRLVEPFSGMAAITVAAASQDRATEYLLNDINSDITAVLRDVVENPHALARAYNEVWEEQFVYDGGTEAHYYKIRAEFNGG